MRITFVLALLGLCTWAGEIPSYLYAHLTLPQNALPTLPEKAQTEGVPMAVATETGALVFRNAESEEALTASGTYLFLDGPFFLLGVEEEGSAAFLRGEGASAEIISMGSPPLIPHLVELMGKLGLLQEGVAVELEERTFPLKIPAPPQGTNLDPVLWGLLISPDWFAFAREHGIERVGLRVRVVAEVKGILPETYEPFIQSSSDGLVELLLPIPLLDDLAREDGVLKVRPPYKPQPLPQERP